MKNGDVATTLENFYAHVIRGSEAGGVVVNKKQIKNSLEKQLQLQKKTSDFYMDLVNDYLFYWDMKKELIKDIKGKGVRYSTTNGNGIKVEKANESIQNLQKTTATMLKILTDLNLKEPLHDSDPESDYL